MNGMRMARIGLAIVSLTAALPASIARAEEEGELFKNLLGSLGVIPEDKPPIDYRERPPLVLPPRMELREPAVPGRARAQNPQWPNDPDVAMRRRIEADARLPAGLDEKSRTANSATPLSPQEMRAGRQAGAHLVTQPAGARGDSKDWMLPDELRAQNHRRNAGTTEAAEAKVVRRSLTEPPSAYRQSATGKAIEKAWEAPVDENPADPRSFHREQMRR